ncbi:DUF485 domain-containing protein [Brevibacillus sp. 179-C9.3 HS]|uniref:DUF485 domain-containing protein n=1 Tax=unclassified Brevibacillus TaxID=2684853 RepID=UPI0039A31044
MSLQQSMTKSSQYRLLLQKKKRFLIPITLFFLLFYFSLPVFITFVPEWMNLPVYGSITLAWIFAVSQCLMTLFLASIYMWKARQFDRIVSELVPQAKREDGE